MLPLVLKLYEFMFAGKKDRIDGRTDSDRKDTVF